MAKKKCDHYRFTALCQILAPIPGDPTLPDAIIDRLSDAAHKIELEGESLHKKSKE